jgi:hypothetical protein
MIAGLEAAAIPPPPAARIGAIVQASVFDAVNGIDRRYAFYHVPPAAPPPASRAAAAAAADTALAALISRKSRCSTPSCPPRWPRSPTTRPTPGSRCGAGLQRLLTIGRQCARSTLTRPSY